MSPREYLLLEYADLPDGTTVSGELCPACGGGASKEGTLSVTRRNGSLLWNCYRATCSFRGAEAGRYTGETGYTSKVSVRGATGRWIVDEAEQIPEDYRALLESRYRLTAIHTQRFRLGWHEGRLVLPVFSVNGEVRGCTLRSLTGQKPKSLSHVETGAIAWYTNRSSRTVIIVEDQLSAIRCSDYANSVALLGTDLSQERMAEIRSSGMAPHLALDKDAYALAIKYAIQYRPLPLLRLAKDVKDMTNEEAFALLQEEPQ